MSLRSDNNPRHATYCRMMRHIIGRFFIIHSLHYQNFHPTVSPARLYCRYPPPAPYRPCRRYVPVRQVRRRRSATPQLPPPVFPTAPVGWEFSRMNGLAVSVTRYSDCAAHAGDFRAALLITGRIASLTVFCPGTNMASPRKTTLLCWSSSSTVSRPRAISVCQQDFQPQLMNRHGRRRQFYTNRINMLLYGDGLHIHPVAVKAKQRQHRQQGYPGAQPDRHPAHPPQSSAYRP